MAIAANRFKFLDNQTNVATVDFHSTKSNDIFNAPNSSTNSLTEELEAFLEKSIQKPLEVAAPADSSARNTKDASSNLLDLSKLSGKDIDQMISSRLPNNPTAQSVFNKLSASCKKKAMGGNGFGKPYDPNINCNGNKRKASAGECGSSEFSGVLNKLTNGQYNSSFEDLNSIFKNLVALAGFGYKLNMCGVFGALANGVDKNVAGRAAGALFGKLGATGNVNGFADLAASSSGLNPIKVLPGAISAVYNNFKMPEGTKQKDYKGLNDKVSNASHALDNNWNKSSSDGILSTKFADKYKDDVHRIIKADSLTNVNEDNLKNPPVNEEAFLSAAYKSLDGRKNNWGKLI